MYDELNILHKSYIIIHKICTKWHYSGKDKRELSQFPLIFFE